MVVVLILLIVMLCVALLVGFQAGVHKNTPASQIPSPDLQSRKKGSTMKAVANYLPLDSFESLSEDDYLPGPDSIFTVKASKKDPLAKQIFSMKGLDAFILQQLLSEYAGHTVGDIVRFAINPIAAASGFRKTPHFPTAQIEIVSPGNTVVRTDVRFFVKHAPKKKPRLFRKFRKGKQEKENQETAGTSPLDVVLIHIEPQRSDYLDQSLLNRAQLSSAADLFGQLEPSGNQYRKYRDVSDVLIVWILFSKDPHQQNRIFSRETSMTVRYDNDNHLVKETKAGRFESFGFKSGKGNVLNTTAEKIREKIGKASWPFNTRTKKSLVTEWFIILGDPNNDSVKKHCPLLYVLDTIFWEDMDNNEKLRILREYGIIKSGKEANIVSHTVMGSPFLVSMEDLEQRNAQLDMEKAQLATEKAQLATEIVRLNGELEAARKEIASLRRSRTRTLTKKGKP